MKPRSGGHSAPVVVVEVGLRHTKPAGRPVAVGERFRSIAWAECSTAINKTHIDVQLSGRVKQCRGVRFGYITGESK